VDKTLETKLIRLGAIITQRVIVSSLDSRIKATGEGLDRTGIVRYLLRLSKNLTPFIPLSFSRRGGRVESERASPLWSTLFGHVY
jgi:hypothetical protein